MGLRKGLGQGQWRIYGDLGLWWIGCRMLSVGLGALQYYRNFMEIRYNCIVCLIIEIIQMCLLMLKNCL